MILSPLLLEMLEPGADLALLASLADYPDDLAKLEDDGGERDRLTHLCFSEEIALPGKDGDQAESLLRHGKESGADVLARITRKALRRALGSGQLQGLTSLFDEDELAELQREFLKTTATADLLGRSRIRLRQQHAERYSEEAPTDFTIFRETPLSPMIPERALAHFKSLVPTLNVDVAYWGPLMERTAFTMAEVTSKAVLKKCQDVITRQLGTVIKPREAVAELDSILERAGISPANSAYSHMVYRTNMAEAFRAGAQAEFSDPDLKIDFPVWKYSGIDDGRERHGPLPKYPDHKRHFGKYWARDVLFADVRGRHARDVIQCRCNFIPVFRTRWAKLQAQGARLEPRPLAA